MQQRLEPRIGTQSVQLWINLGEDDGIGTIPVGLLEPINRFIIFGQAQRRQSPRKMGKRTVVFDCPINLIQNFLGHSDRLPEAP